MFSQLLSRFTGTDDQSKVIQELNQTWIDWLQPINPDKPTGEDLTYHDTFQDIKEQIAKISGIDYSFVIIESENLLKRSSKDIRVATYYCLARLYQDGVEGFAEGLEILACLLDKFGPLIYPSRPNIRKNAIEWLTNARFIEQLTQLQPISDEYLSRIIIALSQIDSSCQKLFDSETPNQSTPPPNLSALVHFFGNIAKQPVKTTNEEQPPQATANPVPVSEVQQSNVEIKISSQRDLLDQARKMAAFLRENPEGYLAAGRFLRVIRWDMIVDLPPVDSKGKTRLPAPRAELKQNINRLILQKQWSTLFERVESAFMESANHFWLDLQRASVLALKKMGEPYQSWADIYLTDIGLMLERLHGIENLYFDNGMPFADDETLSWIASDARIHNLGEGDSIQPIAVSGENDWGEIEKQALELAHAESLEHAFQWIQSLPSLRSPKQQYLLQYTQARVAEQLGKQDIALTLLSGLNNQQQSITLLQWEPELLFDIKRFLLKLIKQKNLQKDNNKNFGEQIENLQHELMQLNPARALSVI